MIRNSTIHLLSIAEVVEALHLPSRRTVERWIKSEDLAVFSKGQTVGISEENLTRFVLLNTLNPKRPDWLTAAVESEFELRMERIVERVMAKRETQLENWIAA